MDSIKAKKDNAMSTGPFGSSIGSAHFRAQGIPVLRGSNLSEDVGVRLQDDDIVFLDPCKAEEFSRSTAEKGDLIFTCWGTVGQVGLIDDNAKYPKYVISNKQMKLTPDPNLADSQFLYYLFSNPVMVENIKGNAIGSSVPGFNLGQLKSMEIELPPIDEQKEIVEIVNSIDDKIQLLQKQNRTLEGLSSALFRYHILESIGWAEKPLDEVATYLNGLALQKFPPNGGKTLNAIKIRELNQGITENTEVCGDHLPAKYIVDSGDILFSWSGSLQIVLWAHGKGALNQHLFKVFSDHYPKWFIYLATKHHLPEFRQIAESKATTMGHIQRQHLTEAMIPCPPKESLQELSGIFDPLLTKIIDNNAQILILIKTRDNILPKLMSGEVRLAG